MDELLYAHMRGASEGTLDAERQPLRLDGAMGYEMMESLISLGPEWQRMVRYVSLPRGRGAAAAPHGEHGLLPSAPTRAPPADWRALGDELRGGRPPRTALGREPPAWLGSR